MHWLALPSVGRETGQVGVERVPRLFSSLTSVRLNHTPRHLARSWNWLIRPMDQHTDPLHRLSQPRMMDSEHDVPSSKHGRHELHTPLVVLTLCFQPAVRHKHRPLLQCSNMGHRQAARTKLACSRAPVHHHQDTSRNFHPFSPSLRQRKMLLHAPLPLYPLLRTALNLSHP